MRNIKLEMIENENTKICKLQKNPKQIKWFNVQIVIAHQVSNYAKYKIAQCA